MNTKELGDLGEKLACEYLVSKGYKILGRNYRISFGEIDIIARRKPRFFIYYDKTIHFIEVKTSLDQGENFFPEDRVNDKKQRKLRQLSEIWLSKNGFKLNDPCQIDVIGVVVDEHGKSKLEYFENVVSGV